MRSLSAIHGVESGPPPLGIPPPPAMRSRPTSNPDAEMAGAQDTIYLCNFRVSVDGDWLCLKELDDVDLQLQDSRSKPPDTGAITSPTDPMHYLMGSVLLCLFISLRVLIFFNIVKNTFNLDFI